MAGFFCLNPATELQQPLNLLPLQRNFTVLSRTQIPGGPGESKGLPLHQHRSSFTPVFGVRSRQLPLSATDLLTIELADSIAILIAESPALFFYVSSRTTWEN